MGNRRPALIAGTVAIAAMLAASGCGSSDDGSPPPNEGNVIVSIGDSVASGEGNPAAEGPRWEERRCHRSATAGQALAANQVRQEHPELGFVSFACSGASVDVGLLGPYRGIEPRLLERPAPPQVDGVRALGDRVAAVMVSIGANDVGFVKVLKFCTVVPRCWEQHFNPDFPLIEAGRSRPTLEQWVDSRLDELPPRYARLDAALSPVVHPDRVVITEYFDPTTAADGSDCTMLFGGVKPEESHWAREHVLVPLNARVRVAAEEHGWRYVDGVDESFRGHGLCARGQRWVRTLGEGLTGNPLPLGGAGVDLGRVLDVIGSTTGTLHPNAAGHQQIATLIAPVLAQALRVEPTS